jgi:hypothetical protein
MGQTPLGILNRLGFYDCLKIDMQTPNVHPHWFTVNIQRPRLAESHRKIHPLTSPRSLRIDDQRFHFSFGIMLVFPPIRGKMVYIETLPGTECTQC